MKKHILPIVLIGLTIAAWVIAYPSLPTQIPIHWEMNGEANGYSSKLMAMLTQVGIMVLIYALFIAVPLIDPKKENYKYFTKAYVFIHYFLLILFFIMNILTLLVALDFNIPMGSLGTFVLGSILIILGNFLQTVRTNYFIGIRTPWTLSSEIVWKRTHRFAGKMMFIAGIIIILSSFLPPAWIEVIIPISIIAAAGLPLIYSYRLYQREIKTINR